MKKMLILIIFISMSCTQKIQKNDFDFFNSNVSFEKFKLKLEEYSSNNAFPNINN